MKDDKNIQAAEAQEQTEEQAKVKLKRPYIFEGKEYAEIDLTGLDKLTIRDAIDVQRTLLARNEAAANLICEMTTGFAAEIAARAAELPIEFFKLMPRGAVKLVVAEVRNFLNVDANTENHIMHLEKPYIFEGKEYTDIDLNGIADMNTINETEAENRLARAGIMVAETTYNYLYTCIVSAMATGLPEEFFTGLPLRELVKLRVAANDPDFFG